MADSVGTTTPTNRPRAEKILLEAGLQVVVLHFNGTSVRRHTLTLLEPQDDTVGYLDAETPGINGSIAYSMVIGPYEEDTELVFAITGGAGDGSLGYISDDPERAWIVEDTMLFHRWTIGWNDDRSRPGSDPDPSIPLRQTEVVSDVFYYTYPAASSFTDAFTFITVLGAVDRAEYVPPRQPSQAGDFSARVYDRTEVVNVRPDRGSSDGSGRRDGVPSSGGGVFTPRPSIASGVGALYVQSSVGGTERVQSAAAPLVGKHLELNGYDPYPKLSRNTAFYEAIEKMTVQETVVQSPRVAPDGERFFEGGDFLGVDSDGFFYYYMAIFGSHGFARQDPNAEDPSRFEWVYKFPIPYPEPGNESTYENVMDFDARSGYIWFMSNVNLPTGGFSTKLRRVNIHTGVAETMAGDDVTSVGGELDSTMKDGVRGNAHIAWGGFIWAVDNGCYFADFNARYVDRPLHEYDFSQLALRFCDSSGRVTTVSGTEFYDIRGVTRRGEKIYFFKRDLSYSIDEYGNQQYPDPRDTWTIVEMNRNGSGKRAVATFQMRYPGPFPAWGTYMYLVQEDMEFAGSFFQQFPYHVCEYDEQSGLFFFRAGGGSTSVMVLNIPGPGAPFAEPRIEQFMGFYMFGMRGGNQIPGGTYFAAHKGVESDSKIKIGPAIPPGESDQPEQGRNTRRVPSEAGDISTRVTARAS